MRYYRFFFLLLLPLNTPNIFIVPTYQHNSCWLWYSGRQNSHGQTAPDTQRVTQSHPPIKIPTPEMDGSVNGFCFMVIEACWGEHSGLSANEILWPRCRCLLRYYISNNGYVVEKNVFSAFVVLVVIKVLCETWMRCGWLSNSLRMVYLLYVFHC